jgi:hypothetical protein
VPTENSISAVIQDDDEDPGGRAEGQDENDTENGSRYRASQIRREIQGFFSRELLRTSRKGDDHAEKHGANTAVARILRKSYRGSIRCPGEHLPPPLEVGE